MGHTPKSTPGPAVPNGGGTCPDCTATADLARDDHGLWHLTIHHDPTCPLIRQQERPEP